LEKKKETRKFFFYLFKSLLVSAVQAAIGSNTFAITGHVEIKGKLIISERKKNFFFKK